MGRFDNVRFRLNLNSFKAKIKKEKGLLYEIVAAKYITAN